MLTEKSLLPELNFKNNTAVYIIGAPGSGKSTFVSTELSLGRYKSNNAYNDANSIITPSNVSYKVFNSDVVSKILSKNDNSRYNGSTKLTLLYMTNYMKSLNNFIYETTGNDVEMLSNLTQTSKMLNYTNVLIYIETNKDNAYINTINRSRNVDKTYFDDVHNKIDNIFKTVSTSGNFNAIYKINNSNNNYTYYKLIDDKLTKRFTGSYI